MHSASVNFPLTFLWNIGNYVLDDMTIVKVHIITCQNIFHKEVIPFWLKFLKFWACEHWLLWDYYNNNHLSHIPAKACVSWNNIHIPFSIWHLEKKVHLQIQWTSLIIQPQRELLIEWKLPWPTKPYTMLHTTVQKGTCLSIRSNTYSNMYYSWVNLLHAGPLKNLKLLRCTFPLHN